MKYKYYNSAWYFHNGWLFPSPSNFSIDARVFIHSKCLIAPQDGHIQNKDKRFYLQHKCSICGEEMSNEVRLEYINRVI